jgi:hypothetical protein
VFTVPGEHDSTDDAGQGAALSVMDAIQVRNEIMRKPARAVSTITDSRDRCRGLRFAVFG